MNVRIGLILLPLVFLFTHAEAKLFRNAYISFELPPNWDCKLEGTEWVCTSQFNRAAKEAIIIFTAKEAGPTDTLPIYLNHLKSPKPLPGKDGIAVPSKVLHVKQRRISDWEWIDSMHLGSEISSYYTRYLATIKDRLAILVTFSAHKLSYTKYSNDFLKAIQSLRVVAAKDILSKRPMADIRQGNETIGAPIGSALPSDMMTEEYPPESTGQSDLLTKLFGLLLLAGAIGFYLFRQLKQKKRQVKKK